jgi:AcrR family transcriptional regulator
MPKLVDHETRRAEIIDALVPLVLTRGINEVSLRSIAEYLDISLGALVHYFKNKDELLDAMGNAFSGRTVELILKNIPTSMKAEARMSYIMELILIHEDQCLVEVLIWIDRARRRSGKRAKGLKNTDKLHREEAYIGELIKATGLNHEGCRMLLTYIIGLVIRRQLVGRENDLQEQISLLEQMVTLR